MIAVYLFFSFLILEIFFRVLYYISKKKYTLLIDTKINTKKFFIYRNHIFKRYEKKLNKKIRHFYSNNHIH